MIENFGLVAAGSAGICQTKVPTPLSESQWGCAEADRVRQFYIPTLSILLLILKTDATIFICSANVGVCIN